MLNERICPACGKPYVRRGRPGRCSSCAEAHRAAYVDGVALRRAVRHVQNPVIVPGARECAWCGSRFRPHRSDHRCCSRSCSSFFADHGHARRFVAAYCPECGDSFVATTAYFRMGAVGGARYCSLSCGRRADRRHHRHLRRARREGKRIHRAKVFERDGWACRLCGDPLDRSADVPHPLAAVIDHIVPLALGGEHAHYNVQAAHFMCNSQKRDLLEGQVAMPV